jgi:hypothetical protein
MFEGRKMLNAFKIAQLHFSMKNVLFAAATVLAVGVAGSAQATSITPAIELTSFGQFFPDNRLFTLGYTFSLSAPVTVDALGYWACPRTNTGHDCFGPDDHQVGIWNSSDVLVASTTVLSADPLAGDFRWHAIPDVTLGAGLYTIGGEFLGGAACAGFRGCVDGVNAFIPAQASGVTTIS